MTPFVLIHRDAGMSQETSVELATPPSNYPSLMAVAGTEDAEYGPGGAVSFRLPTGTITIERV